MTIGDIDLGAMPVLLAPMEDVRIEGRVALLGPNVSRVTLEVALEQAPSVEQANVPGLDELPQETPEGV